MKYLKDEIEISGFDLFTLLFLLVLCVKFSWLWMFVAVAFTAGLFFKKPKYIFGKGWEFE